MSRFGRKARRRQRLPKEVYCLSDSDNANEPSPVPEDLSPVAPLHLTEGEGKNLVLAIAKARGARGFTEAESARVLEWAEEIRFHAMFLHLIVSGQIALDPTGLTPDTWRFRALGVDGPPEDLEATLARFQA